jgi:hypothetical protein
LKEETAKERPIRANERYSRNPHAMVKDEIIEQKQRQAKKDPDKEKVQKKREKELPGKKNLRKQKADRIMNKRSAKENVE